MTTDRRKISQESLERLRITVIELFAEGMFHHVGLREIAKRAGVGLQTIYKYFGTKDELIVAAIEQDLATLTQRMTAAAENSNHTTTREKFFDLGFQYFDFYLSNRHIAQIVFMNIPHRYWVTNPDFIQNEQLVVMEQVIREGQQNGELRNDCEAALLVQMVAGASSRLMINILNSAELPQNGEQANQLSSQMLWPMLRATEEN